MWTDEDQEALEAVSRAIVESWHEDDTYLARLEAA
jgi:hypothetical protein